MTRYKEKRVGSFLNIAYCKRNKFHTGRETHILQLMVTIAVCENRIITEAEAEIKWKYTAQLSFVSVKESEG